jgi:OmpA-OmpF porin, OOP family
MGRLIILPFKHGQKKMNQLKTILLFLLVTLSFGCAQKDQCLYVNNNHQEFLNKGYRQKVDNFLVIFDGSSSMWDSSNGSRKFSQSKNIILGINQAISNLKLKAGLHIIGDTAATKDIPTNESLIYGMTDYSPAAFAQAVNSVQVKGLTPISTPLTKSIETLKSSVGKIAVIVVSDGLQVSADTTSPETAAIRLKAAYGDKLCIYTILIGNDTEGQKTMAAVAKAGECGFATTENVVANTTGMNEFVEKVFFEKVATPPVSFLLNVKFDFDKDTIRPDAKDNLDEVGGFLATHPKISITLEGHTCDMGSERHNSSLSRQRAESVKRYMVRKFHIDPARLATVGYGYSRPVASNATEKGRQQNRRVMATITNK